MLSLLVSSAILFGLALALRPRHPVPAEVRGSLSVLWWINALYCALWHRLEVAGCAPLPERGGAILVSNHTCGIDPLILQAGCRRVLGFLIAKEFAEKPICRPFCRMLGCIPVRRDGRDLAAAREALRALEAGRVVPIFPEGRIFPTSGRELGDAKPGAAFIALRSGLPIVPAYIRGTPKTRDVFRALATPSHTRVVFGEPFRLDDLPGEGHSDKDRLALASGRIMDAIRALKQGAERPD